MKKWETKEEVIAELRRLESEGVPIKAANIGNSLNHGVRKHFGGLKQARADLGIKTSINVTEEFIAARRKQAADKAYTESELIKEVRKAVAKYDGSASVSSLVPAGVKSAVYRRFGGLKKFSELHGIHVPFNGEWTDERISDELAKVSEDGCLPSMKELQRTGYGPLVTAIKRKYGTWNEGIIHFGYEPFYIAGKTDWTREELIERALEAISAGCEPCVYHIEKKVRGFSNQVLRLFGSYDEFKRKAGYCVIKTDRPVIKCEQKKCYTPDLTTVDGFAREVTRLWYVGAPLNYSAISERKRHLLPRANELFGSWGRALAHAGIAYHDVKVSDNSLAEAGYRFEEILGDILTELGLKYDKFAHRRYAPDFVTKESDWYDAKLSEWTDYSEMLPKYLPECKTLTVVYLRGSKRDRTAGTVHKHRKVSVYKLIEGLDEYRRKYYEDKLNDIERSLSVAQTG